MLPSSSSEGEMVDAFQQTEPVPSSPQNHNYTRGEPDRNNPIPSPRGPRTIQKESKKKDCSKNKWFKK
jgi:hypothetical protein